MFLAQWRTFEAMVLGAALVAFYAGDAARLAALLDEDPTIVSARVEDTFGHYCGYFHHATLLHHVAGNPRIEPLPPNGPALAALMIEKGAAVDAVTRPGPSQPDDIGWTPLGLVASSAEARTAGQQRALMELLLSQGASLDARNGGVLMGALYYGEADAARLLAERGATLDLVAAAGLGRSDLVASFVRADGTLAPDAHRLVHYSLCSQRPRTDDEIRSVALVYASMGGHAETVTWLLDHGARISDRALFDHRASALHWAALRGHAEVVELLLARGADTSLRDVTYDSTPYGWACEGGHDAIAARMPK